MTRTKLSVIMKTLLLAGPYLLAVSAVDMSRYSAGPGVEVEFKAYLEGLYASAEDHNACFDFVDFFQAPEQLIVLDQLAYGIEEILALKMQLLPPKSGKYWNHLPNVTTVHSQSRLRKVYHVRGVIETTYDGGNCSVAYYETLFPITRDTDGTMQLQPHDGNLLAYEDFLVRPPHTPTDIPCEK